MRRACEGRIFNGGLHGGLQGFVSSASFLRGVLDKVGLEPTVVRIGKYK